MTSRASSSITSSASTSTTTTAARWQGIVRDAGYSAPSGSTWDGGISNVSLVAGKNLGRRGNVTVYGTYRNIEAVFHGDRDYSSCDLINEPHRVRRFWHVTAGDLLRLRRAGQPGVGGSFRLQGCRATNSCPVTARCTTTRRRTISSVPIRRWTAGLFANYDVHDKVEAYTEFMFMDDRSVAQIAPSGSFFHPDTLNCDNPFLSAQQFEADMRRLWSDEGR